MKKRVLVTGAAGFVGSRVVERLAKNGIRVIATDRKLPKQFPKTVSFSKGDLTDKKFVIQILKNVDLVLHLAAFIGASGYIQTYQADALAQNMAIDSVFYPALIENKVKTIVYASSSMVFQHAQQYPYKETDLATTFLPTNIYGFSKLAGEYFCKAFHKQYGLQYVIMRYHNIYGPFEVAKGTGYEDMHIIPALIEKIQSGQYPLEILGDKNASRPFTYIDDAVDATVRLVQEALTGNRKILNTDFNIGPQKAITIQELAKTLWKLLGRKESFQMVSKTTSIDTSYKREMNPKKIYQAIGWKPKISLQKGLTMLLAAEKR